MRQAKLSLCSVLLISVAGLPAGFAAEKKLKDTVVFQRAELDEKTGKTVAAGNIWVMEADGSGLRQLTQGKKYKEHASVYADQEHVLYAEFSAGNFQPDTEAKLIKHNIYTGKREVIAEKAGCALHHATLSPIDDLLAFHHECGKELSQQVGLGKGSYHVTLRATNGVRRRDGIIAMHEGNSGFVVGERGFGPATALDTVDAPILKPSAFGRGWDLGACVNGGVEGRAGDAPLPPKWLITMGLRQKNRFNECKACGCEPASNHMSGFGFSATDSDSGRRAHGSHERARSARKGRKKHVSVLPRPNRSPWIVVEQNHNGIGKLMVPAFQIYANMNVINDL